MYVLRGPGEMEDMNLDNGPTRDDRTKTPEKTLKSGLRLFRLFCVIFGVLCVLQATLNISMLLVFLNADRHRGPSETSDNDVTHEGDQLKTSDTDLTRKRDELQSSNTDLTRQRDQLQSSNEDLIREKGELEISKEELTRERDDLQRRFCESNDGWKRFGSGCYYVSTEKKNWAESREDCQKREADLVIVNSIEEQEFLLTFNNRVWIGLSDQDDKGNWTWVDGTPLTTAYWNDVSDHQPDNGGGDAEYGEEHCVEIYIYYKVPVNRWNDYGCHKPGYWVCERGI